MNKDVTAMKIEEAEDEKLRNMTKKLMRMVLSLVLIILLIIGGAVLYIAKVYDKETNSVTDTTITVSPSGKNKEETK